VAEHQIGTGDDMNEFNGYEPFVKVPAAVIRADISPLAFRLWCLYQLLVWERTTVHNQVLQDALSVSRRALFNAKAELKVHGLALKVHRGAPGVHEDAPYKERERDKDLSFSSAKSANSNNRPEWQGRSELNPTEYYQPTGQYTPPKPSNHRRKQTGDKNLHPIGERLDRITNKIPT
jgi:hypothetical protein